MNNNLLDRLQRLLESACGLDEPKFDETLQIVNWPENIAAEVKRLVEILQTSGNNVELRACADILNASGPHSVPDGLLQLLSHAVFDNPNTPLSES